MQIKQELEYNNQWDAFVDDVNMCRDLQQLVPGDRSDQLANPLLCFLLCGWASCFKIPVGYFFTKACTGPDIAAGSTHVAKKTEELGFQVVRLVKDNHKTMSWQWKFCAKGNQKHQPHIQQTPPDTCSWHLINTSSTKMWDLNFLLNALGPTKIFLQLLWRSSTRCRRGEQ